MGQISEQHFRLVIVGGGTAGCAVLASFSRIIPPSQIALIEPSSKHFYQPGFTLVAGGLMNKDRVVEEESKVIPSQIKWFKTEAFGFIPTENALTLIDGRRVSYDFLVLAAGLELRFDMIKGLNQELITNAPGICSIYTLDGAIKTRRLVEEFSDNGNVVFTFPNTPIKCSGAPQKICYLTEEFLRERHCGKKPNVFYFTSLGSVYSVPKYSESLTKIIEKRGIVLQTRRSLAQVDIKNRLAIFDVLGEDSVPTGKTTQIQYDLLHIGPPCSPRKVFRDLQATDCENRGNRIGLTDQPGWISVDPLTLQSTKYANIFAIGDCANTPSPKTAAAISSQFGVLRTNLGAALSGKKLTAKYDGYTSCPLVVDKKHVILAEFTPNQLLETFPWDQSQPSRIAFFMKRYLFPFIYWNLLLKGRWKGPEKFRRLFNSFRAQK